MVSRPYAVFQGSEASLIGEAKSLLELFQQRHPAIREIVASTPTARKKPGETYIVELTPKTIGVVFPQLEVVVSGPQHQQELDFYAADGCELNDLAGIVLSKIQGLSAIKSIENPRGLGRKISPLADYERFRAECLRLKGLSFLQICQATAKTFGRPVNQVMTLWYAVHTLEAKRRQDTEWLFSEDEVRQAIDATKNPPTSPSPPKQGPGRHLRPLLSQGSTIPTLSNEGKGAVQSAVQPAAQTPETPVHQDAGAKMSMPDTFPEQLKDIWPILQEHGKPHEQGVVIANLWSLMRQKLGEQRALRAYGCLRRHHLFERLSRSQIAELDMVMPSGPSGVFLVLTESPAQPIKTGEPAVQKTQAPHSISDRLKQLHSLLYGQGVPDPEGKGVVLASILLALIELGVPRGATSSLKMQLQRSGLIEEYPPDKARALGLDISSGKKPFLLKPLPELLGNQDLPPFPRVPKASTKVARRTAPKKPDGQLEGLVSQLDGLLGQKLQEVREILSSLPLDSLAEKLQLYRELKTLLLTQKPGQ